MLFFPLSGERSGHGQGVRVCGAVCGAQSTAADEETGQARAVRFRVVFSSLKCLAGNNLENIHKEFVQIK